MEGFISQDDTEAVLKKVMDDGSFDKLRHTVIDQIKQNVGSSRTQKSEQARAAAADLEVLDRRKKF